MGIKETKITRLVHYSPTYYAPVEKKNDYFRAKHQSICGETSGTFKTAGIRKRTREL